MDMLDSILPELNIHEASYPLRPDTDSKLKLCSVVTNIQDTDSFETLVSDFHKSKCLNKARQYFGNRESVLIRKIISAVSPHFRDGFPEDDVDIVCQAGFWAFELFSDQQTLKALETMINDIESVANAVKNARTRFDAALDSLSVALRYYVSPRVDDYKQGAFAEVHKILSSIKSPGTLDNPLIEKMKLVGACMDGLDSGETNHVVHEIKEVIAVRYLTDCELRVCAVVTKLSPSSPILNDLLLANAAPDSEAVCTVPSQVVELTLAGNPAATIEAAMTSSPCLQKARLIWRDKEHYSNVDWGRIKFDWSKNGITNMENFKKCFEIICQAQLSQFTAENYSANIIEARDWYGQDCSSMRSWIAISSESPKSLRALDLLMKTLHPPPINVVHDLLNAKKNSQKALRDKVYQAIAQENPTAFRDYFSQYDSIIDDAIGKAIKTEEEEAIKAAKSVTTGAGLGLSGTRKGKGK
jgi:hypothetical protein